MSPSDADLTARTLSGVRVAIVEDDEMLCATMRKMLLDEGAELVGMASDSDGALQLAREADPEIMLMDISLEGDVDGVDVADRIGTFSRVPIIYLTGFDDDETIERAKLTAPFGYILKPFTKKELTISMEMALYKYRANQELREKENQLATILAAIPSAVLQIDAESRINYTNPSAEMLLQVPHEKLVGASLWDTITLLDTADGSRLASHADARKRLRSDGYTVPLRMVSRQHERRVVQIGFSTLPEGVSPEGGHVVIIRDVTRQFEDERSIRSMAAALQGLQDAVILTDTTVTGEGPRISYVNRAFGEMTGWSEDEVRGRPLSILGGLPLEPRFGGMIEDAIRADSHIQHETINHTKDGKEFFADWTISAVPSPEGGSNQLVFILRDVTSLRRMEESIRQSQKIEAVGRLAGGIAHDFNNLLAVINSYGDLLTLRLDPDDPSSKYAHQILSAGRKGADLVSQLMLFSRREKPNPGKVHLGSVVIDFESMLRRVIRENIDLSVESESSLGHVMADRVQVEQAIMNLCNNAQDAMEEGGSLTVRVRSEAVTQTDLVPTEPIRPGDYVVVSVADTGHGMDEETRRHIFDPFFTTKAIGKGTGLGLSTVYGTMKQFGGYVRVSSEIGEGSSFDLFFPVLEDTAPEEETAEVMGTGPASPAAGGSERIFIVEDDETFLDCISGLLSLHGYIVETATDGNDAVQRLTDPELEVDLLITDIILPKLSGREVASRLLEAHPETEVLFMTGYDDQSDAFFGFPGDAVVLQKPFPLNTLMSKVREILDNRATARA